jgi:hypothetical protein
MTTIAQTDCCTMLGIDPKTLRHWLRQANMQLIAHPSDARLKCLTQAQVQQLAALHDRPLSSALTAQPVEEHEALPPSPPHSLPRCGVPEADLGQSLARLQAQVTTMQEPLTQLALEWLRERELRLQWLQERQQHTEQRLCTLEALLPLAAEPSPSPQASPMAPVADLSHLKASPECPSPRPGAARGRGGVLPLIAYTATGSYVVICPTKGELPLLPDSPEWFDWLATLSSFRFVGQQGRLSTYRNPGDTSWMAYRRIHGHRYNYGLGNTKLLTIAHLEQMAATLQSYVPSLS